MKNRFTLSITMLIMLWFIGAQAQNEKNVIESFKLTKVSKAVYFDKSEPIRNLDPQTYNKPEKNNLRVGRTNIFKKVKPEETNKPGIVDKVVQTTQGKSEPKFPIQNFDGVPNKFGGSPPDTDGEVGLNHYFQMINVHFAIFDKNGSMIYGPAVNSVLWNGFDGPWSGTNDGDPIILYDERADRWIATQFAVNTNNNKYYELIAVSETPDPTGSYYRYAFEYDDMNDYPKVSVWNNSYVTTYNMFHRTSTSSSFRGAAVAVFDREKLLAGNPEAEQQFFQLSTTYYGMLSADIEGVNIAANSPCPLVHMKRTGSRGIHLFELTVDWDDATNSSLDLVNELTPETFSTYANDVPQPGTSMGLDDFMGQALFRLSYRNFGTHESMVMNHAVGVSGVHGIRWYELRKTGDEGWQIYQQSTFAPGDGVHRWMGSIAINANGDIALGYSASNGDDVYPSIRYTGRTADAPLNVFNVPEVEIIAGSSSQSSSNRWGDYACMTIDPEDNNTFWFTTEYTRNGNWKTRIASFDLNADPTPPTVTAGPDAVICEGDVFQTTLASAESASEYLWETSGSGHFAPSNNVIVTNYIRSSADVEAGGVWLKLTATGYTGEVVMDSLYLTFSREPFVDAGVQDSICKNESYILNPTVENAASVTWTANGDGMFDDVSALNAIYIPGTNDTINHGHFVKLTLSAVPNAPCEDLVTDKVSLYIKDCMIDVPVIYNDKNLIIQPNPSNGVFRVIMDGIKSHSTKLTIYDENGGVVLTEDINTENKRINKLYSLENLSAGIYILYIEQNNRISTKKFIIK